jgi:cytochrome P450
MLTHIREAGSDSKAATLRAIILHIITSPPVYTKLLSEILTASAANKISTPIQYTEAQHLPYLQAVIQESILIYPSLEAPCRAPSLLVEPSSAACSSPKELG